MKVKDLLEILQKMDSEADICALIYDKTLFDFEEDDDVILTDAGWAEICNHFDEQPFDDIVQSISEAVYEFAEDRQ